MKHDPKDCKKKKCFLCAYPKAKRIKTIEELNEALRDRKPHEFRMYLAGGAAYSKKTIQRSFKPDIQNFRDPLFYKITNHIDESKQILNERELINKNHTNIGASMKAGGFWFIE